MDLKLAGSFFEPVFYYDDDLVILQSFGMRPKKWRSYVFP